MNEDVPPGIRPTGFQDEYPDGRIGTQAMSQYAPGGAAADDYEIVWRFIVCSHISSAWPAFVRRFDAFTNYHRTGLVESGRVLTRCLVTHGIDPGLESETTADGFL
jgi:hypothetical protein